ncbi:UNKNOWN [Stylonychia lemnae]|uniref:Transmembrane protein n=1 Tax=Stylonychia lemnae TaxID=5949 RepID=A0A078ASL2_STYLE|nr:UNKNOWN [Stylonychia lemnae]|eukprot:CDW85460.1 UNKNOWN [Stylonychia lemnae]
MLWVDQNAILMGFMNKESNVIKATHQLQNMNQDAMIIAKSLKDLSVVKNLVQNRYALKNVEIKTYHFAMMGIKFLRMGIVFNIFLITLDVTLNAMLNKDIYAYSIMTIHLLVVSISNKFSQIIFVVMEYLILERNVTMEIWSIMMEQVFQRVYRYENKYQLLEPGKSKYLWVNQDSNLQQILGAIKIVKQIKITIVQSTKYREISLVFRDQVLSKYLKSNGFILQKKNQFVPLNSEQICNKDGTKESFEECDDGDPESTGGQELSK